MKKALYIHGLGSNKNSNTAKQVKEILKDKYEVLVEEWNLLSPKETSEMINKYVNDNNINLIVASSLGAFYALSVTDSVARIVINPCMNPAIEVPKLISITQEIVDDFKILKDGQDWFLDGEMRAVTFGIFGNNDELFNYQERFKRLYGNMTVVEGGHRLSHTSLKEGIEEGLGYFIELRESLRRIDNII